MQFYTSKQLIASADFLPLTINEKKTFKALMMYINAKSRSCHILYKTIAESSGLSLRTVKRHVSSFIESGIIKRVKNFYLSKLTNERRQTANTYFVDDQKLLEWIDYHLAQSGKRRYSKIQWKAIANQIKQLALPTNMTLSPDTVLKGTVKIKQNNKNNDTQELKTTLTSKGVSTIQQLKLLFNKS